MCCATRRCSHAGARTMRQLCGDPCMTSCSHATRSHPWHFPRPPLRHSSPPNAPQPRHKPGGKKVQDCGGFLPELRQRSPFHALKPLHGLPLRCRGGLAPNALQPQLRSPCGGAAASATAPVAMRKLLSGQPSSCSTGGPQERTAFHKELPCGQSTGGLSSAPPWAVRATRLPPRAQRLSNACAAKRKLP